MTAQGDRDFLKKALSDILESLPLRSSARCGALNVFHRVLLPTTGIFLQGYIQVIQGIAKTH